MLSGLSEFAGAVLTALVWGPLLRRNPWLVSYTLCVVAGIMVAACFAELLPAALSYKRPALVNAGVLFGALVMVTTMWVV